MHPTHAGPGFRCYPPATEPGSGLLSISQSPLRPVTQRPGGKAGSPVHRHTAQSGPMPWGPVRPRCQPEGRCCLLPAVSHSQFTEKLPRSVPAPASLPAGVSARPSKRRGSRFCSLCLVPSPAKGSVASPLPGNTGAMAHVRACLLPVSASLRRGSVFPQPATREGETAPASSRSGLAGLTLPWPRERAEPAQLSPGPGRGCCPAPRLCQLPRELGKRPLSVPGPDSAAKPGRGPLSSAASLTAPRPGCGAWVRGGGRSGALSPPAAACGARVCAPGAAHGAAGTGRASCPPPLYPRKDMAAGGEAAAGAGSAVS